MPGACRSAAKPAARREGLHAGEGLAEAPAAREQPSKGLTLELSGGVAVRLERNVRRVRRDALERWLVARVSAKHEQPTTPKLPALKAEDLPQR